MKFSLVDGMRTQPSPRLRGICNYCAEPTVSRCGSKRIWHWAHLPNQHCDPWWENETPWHRKWKDYFPETDQEVVHFDPISDEKHVADVKTDIGLVIEFQNSPMDAAELKSREDFYGDMIWIINGEKFQKSFFILDPLPDPRAEFAQDIVFSFHPRVGPTPFFWRLSENPNHELDSGDLVLCHALDEIKDQIDSHYVGHHLFDWKRPRSVWFGAKKPVYIDFGSDTFLLRLDIYRNYGGKPIWSVQYVSKQIIIESNGGIYPTLPNKSATGH